jgi:hypothetical protein
MSSFSIEIDGQNGFNQPIVIVREMPQQLSTYMSINEWNCFCDTVDTALEPVMEFKKKLMGGFKSLGIIPFALLIIFIGISSTDILTPSDPGFVVMFLCWPVITFGLFYCFFKKVHAGAAKLKEELANACINENKKRQGVTFVPKERVTTHIRSNRKFSRTAVSYIECTVPSTGITMGNAPASKSMFDTMATGFGAAAPASSGGRSAAERLQELEGIKALISEEDYNNKKDAILAQL